MTFSGIDTTKQLTQSDTEQDTTKLDTTTETVEDKPETPGSPKEKKPKGKGFLSFFKRSKESPKKEKEKKSAKKKKTKSDSKDSKDLQPTEEEKLEVATPEVPEYRIEIGENEKAIDIGDAEMDADGRILVSKKSVVKTQVTRTVTTSDGKTHTESSKSTDIFTDNDVSEE